MLIYGWFFELAIHMILSIDFRTDIAAFYHEWILERFKQGYLMYRNPTCPSTLHKIVLDDSHVEAIMWCSKDYSKILPSLDEITSKFKSFFHYTITGYPKTIEVNVPSIEHSIETYKQLVEKYGKERCIWRYDPILVCNEVDYSWHIKNFTKLCGMLDGHAMRCVINFVSMYPKVKRRMPSLVEMAHQEKKSLIKEIVAIASQHGIELQACGSALQFANEVDGLSPRSCIDKSMLNSLGLWPRDNNEKTQFGCHCYPNHSIGEYDTCMHNCQYCYASSDFEKCRDRHDNQHFKDSPLLIGKPHVDEKIITMKPKLIDTKQLDIFYDDHNTRNK